MAESHPRTSPGLTEEKLALYREVVQTAAQAGTAIMGSLAAAARQNLQARASEAAVPREREALAAAAQLLQQHEAQLCRGYPQALLRAFALTDPGLVSRPADLHFDQLEQMDQAHVRASVALARTLQSATLMTQAALSDLTALLSALHDQPAAYAERNPLRAQVYANALQALVGATEQPPSVQMAWLTAMGPALGQELRKLYSQLSARLRAQGVIAHGEPNASNPQGAAAAGSGDRTRQEALLTLDKLHRLLSGELAQDAQAAPGVAGFAAQFDQLYEQAAPSQAASDRAADTDFASTVPAALEALTEMNQVERVVQSLEQRRATGQEAAVPAGSSADVQAVRQSLRRNVRDMAQALSLEVVTLMVDNMARDGRLLPPVRALVQSLEPALLRLALVDPRFFTDKQHPARELLQGITDRSFAFSTESAPGFAPFAQGIANALRPLLEGPVDSAEPFEQALASLRSSWAQASQDKDRERDLAVQVLQHAEERNVLAEKIAREIDTLSDAQVVSRAVLDFLCGPWAQVLAQARLKPGATTEAEKYQQAIAALLWSAHPEHAHQNIERLTRLVPRLLETLREGLATIHYTPVKTSAFLEKLMSIHQKAFLRARGAQTDAAPTAQAPLEGAQERLRWIDDGNPWIAPQEAQSSNFLELSEMTPQAEPAEVTADLLDLQLGAPSALVSLEDLVLGSWVEIQKDRQWVRTQLTWASPHGTLFLFTSAFGATQSMTRRTCDRLLAAGQLRLVSAQAVVDGALNAVAQTAMRNSVDSKL